MMRNKVKRFIQQKSLPVEGSKVIIGLSGGADSIVLLHILHRLGYDCVAAHCNFHLRGEESERDQNFAGSFAGLMEVPFYCVDFDTNGVAAERKISIEMAARDLRYEWLEQLRKDLNADAIAVGHHQDDNVETMLLNLIRGTGIKGLIGIKPKNGWVIRPLLCLSKNEILQYAKEEQLTFVTDSSNLQDEYTRNKIRLQLLPVMKTINPSVSESLVQTMKNLEEAAKVYDAGIDEACSHVFDADRGIIRIPDLMRYPSPESILYEILKEYGFNKEVVSDILDALTRQSGKLFYSPGYCLLKDRNSLLLTPLKEYSDDSEYFIDKMHTSISQPFAMEISHQEYQKNFEIIKDKRILYLDTKKIIFPLLIRKWKPGDFFIPFGMKGNQKISDYFSDHKFSLLEKKNTWILCSGEEVVWIVGHRADNRFRIDENTKTVCILKLS